MNDRVAVLGFGCVVLAAIGFAANATSAVISYQEGAGPLSVTVVRLAFTAAALYVFIRLSGATVRLPPTERKVALLYGIVTGVQSFALLKSMQLIPVGLAILTFYVYPILTGIVAHFTGRDRLGWRIWIALPIAFLGLALALDITGGRLNLLGVVYALFAAVTMSALALLTAPMMIRTGDSRPITFHMNLSASVMFALVCLVAWDLPLPHSERGWIGFVAVPLFYAVAITAFYASIWLIGPVRSTLFMNLEPVATTTCGFVILGQALTPLQIFGMLLVLSALILVRTGPAVRKVAAGDTAGE